MNQKSSLYFQEERQSPLEVIDTKLRKHCDYICGAGIGVLISTMIGLIFLLILW
jgi:hypothetical protein